MVKNALHNVSHSHSPEDEAFPPLPPPHSPGPAGPDHRDPFGYEEEEGNVSTLVDVPSAKRRVKRPQPKLDSNRLISQRGLPALRSLFHHAHFKGKGHEASDLRQLMQQMENWSHRLFPKLQFEDFVDKVEKLGNKKEVQTCLKRIRLDLPLTDEDFMGKEGEEEAPEPQMFEEPDPFSGPSFSQGPVHSTPAPPAPAAPPAPSPPSLTEEQQRRMEENRRRALERRLARHQQQTDASDEHTSTSSSSVRHRSEEVKEEEEEEEMEEEEEDEGKVMEEEGLDLQPVDSSSSSSQPVSQSPHTL